MTSELLGRALVEEATKKSGLIWVQGPTGPARALWHVWHEGAALLVGDGPDEQPLPGLTDGGTARVTVRSKDKGGRLVAWTARVAELTPGTEAWQTATGELKGKRLNAVDAEHLLDRWAVDCRVLRLEPRDALTDHPEGSLAAVPLPTPAITRGPAQPAVPRLMFGRRSRARRGDR
ncbi:hypothetical protein [Streptomyces sp. NPDC058045]|uniref:hypothetical protein n=1 Tax=Streptomyces sp. NPDC058045 TaxID=3346311 RepID=UPI0036EF0AC1